MTKKKSDRSVMLFFFFCDGFCYQSRKGGLQRLKLLILKEGGREDLPPELNKSLQEWATPREALSLIYKSQDDGMLKSGVFVCIILHHPAFSCRRFSSTVGQ